MAGTPKGHIESISAEEATLAGNLNSETEEETTALPRVGVEQLRARREEIAEAGQQLAREYEKVNKEIRRHGDGGRARTTAQAVHQRILTDDGALPHFARASQNIAAATALLHGLPQAATSEDRRGR